MAYDCHKANTPVVTDAINRRSALGMLLMTIVAALSAIDAVLVRYLADSVHPFVMGFTRAGFGLLVVLPWILTNRDVLSSHYRWFHVVRAALKLVALILFFFAFARASLADVTAIAFTTPMFVTVGAWFFLSERPHPLRIVALLVGFAGVLFVLGPAWQADVPTGLLLALVAAILIAVIQLMLKSMSSLDSSQTLVAWNLLVTVPLALVPAILVWSAPTPAECVLLALQGALGALNMFLATKAFALADASLVAPFEFLRLPFVALLGYLLFAQPVSITTWIGGVVIFAATLVMASSARNSTQS